MAGDRDQKTRPPVGRRTGERREGLGIEDYNVTHPMSESDFRLSVGLIASLSDRGLQRVQSLLCRVLSGAAGRSIGQTKWLETFFHPALKAPPLRRRAPTAQTQPELYSLLGSDSPRCITERRPGENRGNHAGAVAPRAALTCFTPDLK
jgi:hypothetical protein